MRQTLVLALRATAVTLVLTGLVYPLVVTALAQAAFPRQANGSVVTGDDGTPLGSELLAQAFTNPAYVEPRPSAAGASGYDATASGGSNLGPTSKKLRDRVTADVERLRRENPSAPGPLPAELVTTSGSGLDPQLSPDSVLWQIPRIAAARGVSEERVRAVVTQHETSRDLGFLGEPRVNVLLLNLALDRHFGRLAAGASMNPR
jgi:potassium-transporting ATPase KdpC subunit